MNAMRHEASRSLVCLSGLAIVALAQFTGGAIAAAYSVMAAFSFLILSGIVTMQQKRMNLLLLEIGNTQPKSTDKPRRPFMTTFVFYAGLGVVLLLLPVTAASAAGVALVAGFFAYSVIKKR